MMWVIRKAFGMADRRRKKIGDMSVGPARTAICVLLAAASACSAGEPGSIREEHVMLPMRDGVRLSTRLLFPPGTGPWPVLYQQRYGSFTVTNHRAELERVAKAGYVVCAQNFRGTQQSEGQWIGYRALGAGKVKDGYDTVEWLAKQPWSTGKIGTWGGSQAAYAQNFLAVSQPPHLVAQHVRNGGLSIWREHYRLGGTTRGARYLGGMARQLRDPADDRRMILEWFEHPTADDWWAEEDCNPLVERFNVPCFTVTGWYDFMCTGSIENFLARKHRGGPISRISQKLLIGPWPHGTPKGPTRTTVGDLTYPENAKLDSLEHVLRWHDHYLKGIDNGVDREPEVRYYVMGAVDEPDAPGNAWRTATDFPPAIERASYYFIDEGRLTTSAPSVAEGSTTFLADPLHPNVLRNRQGPVLPPTAMDAREYEGQSEVRTFSTEPLDEPVEWTGKVTAELYISSTARDTDFIVRVSDVYPDGRSILICDCVRRARYREGLDREVFLEPGVVTKVVFDVGWLSQNFNCGHRIRITVASTGAPFYDPNPNTGEPLTIDFPDNPVVAENTLYHNRQQASRVIVPEMRR